MPATDTTLTVTLFGHPTLSLFSEAVGGLNDLVVALGKDIGVASVEWSVEYLDTGSSVITVHGYDAAPEAITQITDAVIVTANVMNHGQPSVLAPSVRKAARRLIGVVDGLVPTLSIVSGDAVVSISAPLPDERREPDFVVARGVLTGLMQTISLARGRHFRILEESYGRSVPGRFDSELSETMRELWGRRAAAEGLIARERRTGRPMWMTDVQRAWLEREVAPGTFQCARGALSPITPAEPSEVTIRRLRDAS